MYDIKYTDNPTIEEKLRILSDAAKYDVACTSSGVDRKGRKGYLGNSCAAGICHSFAADGRCISLLKVLLSNHCIYDCRYCINRRSNDIERATFTEKELCSLVIEFYKRNYIEGLFLSSGIIGSPDNTMEMMCRVLRALREEYSFNGYIHIKAIPGASDELIYSAGLLADRISINMELPNQSSLGRLAPNKNMVNIIRPMSKISETIAVHRVASGYSPKLERAGINRHLINSIMNDNTSRIDGDSCSDNRLLENGCSRPYLVSSDKRDVNLKRPFAPAGQSTQMIIGASGETDFELINTTERLYKSFDLKRVFFSAYVPLNEDSELPVPSTPVPLVREHRLYQADWLLRFYGFNAGELLDEDNPNFDERIDPKCNWALRHIDRFPIEINTASWDDLMRVPGIGPTGVKRIMSARRYGNVTFDMLKQMRVVLKRARFFITCSGRMMDSPGINSSKLNNIDSGYILRQMIELDRPEVAQLKDSVNEYRQLDLFTDFGNKL